MSCSIVTRSNREKGFSIAIWNGYVAKDHDYKNWYVWKVKKDKEGKDIPPTPDYNWA